MKITTGFAMLVQPGQGNRVLEKISVYQQRSEIRVVPPTNKPGQWFPDRDGNTRLL